MGEDFRNEMVELEARVPNLGLTGVIDSVSEMKRELEDYQKNAKLILM